MFVQEMKWEKEAEIRPGRAIFLCRKATIKYERIRMIKKSIWVLPVVLFGMLLGGCKKDSVSSLKEKVQAIAQISKSKSKLDELFTYDMLESTVYELEKVIGKPRKKSGTTWEYKVDGCPVTVETAGENIRSLEVDVSSSCTFDLNQVAMHPEGTYAHQLTFGKFFDVSGEMTLFDMGWAEGFPSYPIFGWRGAYWTGSEEKPVVMIAYSFHEDADKALDKFLSLLERKTGRGPDDLDGIRFNKYSRDALQTFKDVPITRIKVGVVR